MTTKVFFFGSPNDTLAWEVADRIGSLAGFEFIKSQNPDDIINLKDANGVIVIDSARGIMEPKILSIESFSDRNIVTSHDLDVGLVLALMKKINRVDNIKVIGIPLKAKLTDGFAENVKRLLLGLK